MNKHCLFKDQTVSNVGLFIFPIIKSYISFIEIQEESNESLLRLNCKITTPKYWTGAYFVGLQNDHCSAVYITLCSLYTIKYCFLPANFWVYFFLYYCILCYIHLIVFLATLHQKPSGQGKQI